MIIINAVNKKSFLQLEIFMLFVSCTVYLFSIYECFKSTYLILLCFSAFIITRYFAMMSYDRKPIQIILYTASFIVSLLLCVINPQWYCFLMLVINIDGIDEIKSNIRYCLIMIIPLSVYILYCCLDISNQTTKATIISGIFILICCSIDLVINIIIKYIEQSEKNLRNALDSTAMSDLSQKKLNRELLQQNYLAEKNARYEEREKIGRTIHNVVGHTITSAIMALDASEAIYEVSHEEAVKKLSVANDRMHQSLSSIRQAVRVMDESNKPVLLSDLCDMLKLSIEDFVMDTDIKIRHNICCAENDILLSADNANFINGALLEFLSNGIHHAAATTFIVLLSFDEKHIKLSVTDNGIINSFDEHLFLSSGFGLNKIYKYALKQGGSLNLSYSDGLCAELVLPLI